ncbi:cytochrome c heme-lyase [Babesia microti strain RI]|uniref:Holocytochrome c-type synthase n=1 Tax=Babesia microti (strain RI) TaxID=1133968 RepID=I7I9Y0_BABMR|nr:cytochrome c heme-lyase [Babesia microti strain RI]CCF75824.1 cytochrome c heme-lyase [Babesia microti strain RI]|eukprot:XP_012650232.1 cytochrome c heme-lyase [Babesia microti strain RI]
MNSERPHINPDNLEQNYENAPIDEHSAALDLTRETSSIPRPNEPTNWMYPSPQQFYNALKLKHKDPGDPKYMKAAVFAHNRVNELTWDSILSWERWHPECKLPKLQRFVGKFSQLSPKARLKSIYMGRPFDRHDWYIDRCGETVRYIIDYYDDPKANDVLKVKIDARPALDSFTSFFDRLLFWIR